MPLGKSNRVVPAAQDPVFTVIESQLRANKKAALKAALHEKKAEIGVFSGAVVGLTASIIGIPWAIVAGAHLVLRVQREYDSQLHQENQRTYIKMGVRVVDKLVERQESQDCDLAVDEIRPNSND